ncbi:MAG: efflux RND transporter periplasmic adaptor subunit [Acidobacteria bacterium]|nr:efflux RND transporter periplasmic adaptor subunit [Acidobacteriota bacterium]
MKNEIENSDDRKDLSGGIDPETKDLAARSDPFAENSDLRSRKRIVIFGGIAGIVILGVAGFSAWYFLSKSDGGKPVPAPRNTSFGEPASGGKLPAGEQRVVLTDAQLAAADLKIVEVGETLDAASINETTTGIVRANDYGQTPVITQVSGVVKTINAVLGQSIRKGQIVAVISSEELSRTQAEYLSLNAGLDEAQKRYKRAIELSGVSQEVRSELDTATADLKAAEADHARHLSHYERTEKLVKIGAKSRDEFEQVKAMHQTAMAKLEEAKKRFERARELLKINPARKNEIDQFLTKIRNQQSAIASVREKLVVLGLSRQRVNSLKSADQISADLSLAAPVSGTVTERIVNRGEVVSMNGILARITDLSTVWVIGQVYEKDLGRLRIGSGASITSETFPGELFRGQIAYVDPTLDERTRTAQVRVEIPNPNQKLKIGQYVNIAYSSLGGSEKTAPLVSKDSVQIIGNQKVVFQATEDPKTFVIRPIKLGQESENGYPVAEGIFVGDRIVADGSFLLRAEFLKTNSSAN